MSTPYIISVERQRIEKGALQGLQVERALLVRQVQQRFDAHTAEQLAELLQAIDDPDRLADIGEWLIDSNTGAVLLNRVQELVKDG